MCLTASGPIAGHIFGPAMPDAARDLGSDVGSMQRTLSAYLTGFATGHLFLGTLADRFGRRPVVLAGLLAYVVTSIGAALALGVWSLTVLRLMQGMSAAAGIVIGRAMVRDLSSSVDASRKFALLGLVLSGAPVLAPALGGWVAEDFGWRWIFAGLAVATALLLAVCAARLPETRAATLARPPGMLSGLGVLVRSRRFIGYGLGGALTGGSPYAFLAAAPFIYVDLYGVTLSKVGLYILSLMLGLSAGAIVAGRIAGRWPIARIALAASVLGLVAALALLAQALAGTLGALSITASMMGMVFANGLLIPNSLAGAMETDERLIAAAGGLAGFLTQGTGVLCTLAVSLWYGHSALPMVWVLIAANILGVAIMSWGLSGGQRAGKKPGA